MLWRNRAQQLRYQRDMHIEIGLRGLLNRLPIFAFRCNHGSCNECGNHGSRGNEAKALMNLQHLCALFKACLQFRVALKLLLAETQILERWFLRSLLTIRSRLIGQLLLRRGCTLRLG